MMNEIAESLENMPEPVRLRVATDVSIGTTAFFRNRPLLAVLNQRLAALPVEQISILVHACSIGAEVWSLLIASQLHPQLRDRSITVFASDIEPEFVAYAERGIYPRIVLEGMRPEEQAYFHLLDDQSVQVSEELRRCVRFLPAGPVESLAADQMYDVVMLLNVLLYLPGEQQSRVVDQVADYNSHLLVATGFHFDRIKEDLVRNNYRPIAEDARKIHDGWLDRRRDAAGANETIPGKIFHPWSLQPFQEIEDYEYKYCALFEKRS